MCGWHSTPARNRVSDSAMPADSSHQPTRQAPTTRLLVLCSAPLQDVVTVKPEAEQVGGNESSLRSPQTYDADDDAVDRCDHPSLPATTTDQDRRANRQDARNVVQSNQSNTTQLIHNSFFSPCISGVHRRSYYKGSRYFCVTLRVRPRKREGAPIGAPCDSRPRDLS
jgi:hypothetical protein